jgi:hypothetical protein
MSVAVCCRRSTTMSEICVKDIVPGSKISAARTHGQLLVAWS